ncbi:L-aspartate oxidase [Fimbriimonas ginsengisoli]|uniref:L-aspartate oxidase n=1 Tax=Fimbriimonas ginsengisoli Gsoil 348 TaxID=661478 RepID=A0A068NPH1_FIMGI|nr:L-aspartate oxidase [Fimbriimonas ginsengisoli]AIE84625.1 L-aspartate oxidase [Fimbriimonas ginsengisoli Gsoil 348]
MNTSRFDFLVIGSGLAGLTYALRAARHGRVCVLTKGEVTDSNTSWAQGGIAAAVGEADSWELHEQDTLIAGAGLCDEQAVRFLVQQAPEAIRWLIELGARFDFDGNDLALGREGGHSRNRIVHHADKTGWEIERTVVAAVRQTANIEVFQHAYVTQLLMSDGRCVGAEARLGDDNEPRQMLANAVMLATGGCGRMYQHTTNPRVATADGIGLGSAVGARVENMEFMQFHPTTLFHPQMRSFLITEAVRGAGGTLRNHLGRRFMYDYDPRLELAPRDVVARAIEAEMKKHGTWCVYLDMTHLRPELIRHEFPTIHEKLASIGLEIEKDWIPVVPAQHYSCGGVVTDLNGQTTVPGLYAAGEVASTGVHGANRLASNSLLEALVFAVSAAEASAGDRVEIGGLEKKNVHCISEAESIRIRRALQRTMTNEAGIVRTFHGLEEAKQAIDGLIEEYHSLPETPFSQHPHETLNLMLAARYVVDGALSRDRNVGLHFNSDLEAKS